jgi:large subunit ribosomal protein L13
VDQKVYHRHSGFPGGLRTETASKSREVSGAPDRARRARHAADQPMRDVQLRRLKVYVGAEHPHAPQQPKELV